MDRYSIDDIVRHSAGLSAEVMQDLADYAGVGLFNLHIPSGEILLNRNITLLTGYEPGDLPHSKDTKSMLTFEDDRPRVAAAMQSLMSGEASRYQLEYRMRRQDGSIVSVQESALVYERDENGTPVRIAAMALDLSRLKWAEEKARMMEAENRRLARGSTEGELADQNRMLRAANAAAAMIIGGFHQDYETLLHQSLQILGESVEADRAYLWRSYSEGDRLCCFKRSVWSRVGGSYASFTPDTPDKLFDYDDILPNWQQLTSDKAVILARVDDLPSYLENFPIEEDTRAFMLVPLFLHGDFWGFVGFDECDSERTFSYDEAEIMGAGALVIASSVSRNETFFKLNEARAAAMASTKAKGEFLSRMSHEIRTPMNAIIGMTTIAKRSDDADKIRYCLDKVDASSRQLLSLINDVLDMSKIDANKLEIVPAEFDFEKMTQNVFSVVQVKLEEKHQDFHLDFNHIFTRKVFSDELRLSQVLINLLNNAMKFTPEGGFVSLKIREKPIDRERSTLHVEVVDTGIGIAADQKDKLFDSFEQADGSITRQYGGTGLGLAICKKIINLMGGDIWVESEPGEGSRFIFEVEIGWGEPLLKAGKTAHIPEELRILVVDDNDDVLEYFKNILTGFSLECDTAPGGQKAIAMVQQSLSENRPYDIVFIDWNMPGMNGGATAKELERLVGTDIIIVMISVADWSDIEKEAKGYGIHNFLSKPVLPSVLYNTIVQLTEKTLITPAAQPESEAPNWSGKTVLLAEDIEINREIMASILEDTGVTILNAADGKQAVDLYSNNAAAIDLILMDIQMPNLDGLQATRRIRGSGVSGADKVPIIAMTANAFKEDEQMCLDAGMDGHLAKPIDVDALFATLKGYLGA